MLKLVSRFILVLVIFSCSSSKKYPSWYLNAPKNNAQYLYGTGEGYDMDEAKISALNDASSKLRTIVSSKTQSAMESDNIGTSSSFAQKISSQVDKILFNNYEVLKAEQVNQSFVVMVGIKSQLLISAYKNEINKANNEVNNLSSLSGSKLEKRENLLKINKIYSSIESKVRIVESIDDSYDARSQFAIMSEYINKFNILNSQLEYRIICDDTDIENYLIKRLNEDSIKISNSGKESIKVNYKWVLQELKGLKMAKILMTVKYIDEFGKVIKSDTIESSGNSITSFDLAKKNALQL